MKGPTGLTITYSPQENGAVAVEAVSADGTPAAKDVFEASRIDEARILYMEAAELLRSRAALGEAPSSIRATVEKLFALFRGEKVSFADPSAAAGSVAPERVPSGEFVPNPGKSIDIDIDGVTYERLPVRTRLITLKDADIMPLLRDYVQPWLRPGDALFISEKALTLTQGRVVDMGMIRPSRLARILGSSVGNYYGTEQFRGFGHGTAIAMQAFIEEAGYPRVLFAAAVSAITRPFGIKGMFYRICGTRAKSVDCPMSFLILEYAHSVKLAPDNPADAARRIKKEFGCETVILDANYRGAFSLGKSARAITEQFIGKAFRDNPLGQSDEMTPFCILRKK
ncbi:MAG: hypothetical protein P4L67_03205 [Candidatus Pacebacteria bacterium]|nr:hypothetical protein [Candidatus Paceibacterota bacterium]